MTSSKSSVALLGSEQLYDWLNQEALSFAFTTYQTNRLFLVGCGGNGHLAVNERLFDKPMGLYARGGSLYMGTRYQLWQLDNCLAAGERHQLADRLYVPRIAYTTGDLNVHDVVMTADQQWLFINTDFSCLATLQPDFSFVPLWQPPFISKLVAEDRCHLNGLAMQGGKPTFATACSRTDTAAGWRNHRVNGGIVMHIPSNEIIATGLSMPHSPRWYQGRLWLLNSGSGELGYLDGEAFVPMTFCPGFVRGLAFWRHYALVGLSKLRSPAFSGLPLETRLAASGDTAQCGMMVVDLNTGDVVHWLHIDGVVEELFDVVVLPAVRQPQVLGFQNDDIERLVTFPGSGGVVTTKPTVKRPGIGMGVQAAGLPRQNPLPLGASAVVKYQRVYHLTPDNLLPYEAMTLPSLKQRWQTQARRGELLAVSASVAGEMVGLAVAERWLEMGQTKSEMISLHVLPAYQAQAVAQKLAAHLQKALMLP